MKHMKYSVPNNFWHPEVFTKTFCIFDYLQKLIQTKAIPHLKALKIAFKIVKNWAWHHSEGSQALKIEKASLVLKLVLIFLWLKFFC